MTRIKPFTLAVVIFYGIAAVSGCGKSKAQIAQEAEQQRVKAAAAASEAHARQAEADRTRSRDAKLAELQTKLTQAMKDPTSVQFKEIRLNTPMTAICGQFNAKNSFGGYVGFREFISGNEGTFIKPEGCGVVPVVDLIAADATACMKYVLAKGTNDICQ
jgi:hypothetical protein